MRLTRLTLGTALICFLESPVVHAEAEGSPTSASITLSDIVVEGQRLRLSNALETKREKLEIVDSVVADEISKLPDFSISEAMQRITGVQITRDRGEGSALQGFYATNNALSIGVTIRGLPMVQTLLNGREVFTAGGGRTFNFAELVDLRMWRPFDFDERHVVLTGGVINGNLADKTQPLASVLASDRWDTGWGEFGALLNIAYQKRSYLEDYYTSGNPTLSGGQYLPSSWTNVTNNGDRERIGGSIILQWRPTDRLELFAEAHKTQFKTRENATVLSVSPAGGANASNIVLFQGTNDASSVTWDNATVSTTGQSRDTIDRNTQIAIGGEWIGDALSLSTDLSHTKSENNLEYSGLNLSGATATGFTHQVAGKRARANLNSSNLLNLASFTSASSWYAERPFEGKLTALQLDGEYQLDGKILDTLSTGIRYAEREADNKLGQIGSFPSTVSTNAVGAVLRNTSSDLGPYLVGNPSFTRNVASLRQLLGISASIPSSNPLGTWKIEETTKSAYAMAKLQLADLPLDGNIGIRVIRTDESLEGFQGTDNANVSPLSINRSYTDTLPSMNLRYELMPGLYLRGAVSKTITRPDFNKKSPSLTLNPSQLRGGAGNPDLRPIRAINYDIAVEKYFNKLTSIYATAFKKNVDGFISDATTLETYGGLTYEVTRPFNTGASVIRGAEIGYQQFYDFLPGWLSGLGLQANYTYVDSDVEQSNLPLAGLSQHSYNIIGMYEKGPVSVRVAYNWRDQYLTSISAAGMPIYMDDYGWLDASISYRFTNNISLAIDGTNLQGTKRRTFYAEDTRPQTTWKNDTQVSATITVSF